MKKERENIDFSLQREGGKGSQQGTGKSKLSKKPAEFNPGSWRSQCRPCRKNMPSLPSILSVFRGNSFLNSGIVCSVIEAWQGKLQLEMAAQWLFRGKRRPNSDAERPWKASCRMLTSGQLTLHSHYMFGTHIRTFQWNTGPFKFERGSLNTDTQKFSWESYVRIYKPLTYDHNWGHNFCC